MGTKRKRSPKTVLRFRILNKQNRHLLITGDSRLPSLARGAALHSHRPHKVDFVFGLQRRAPNLNGDHYGYAERAREITEETEQMLSSLP